VIAAFGAYAVRSSGRSRHQTGRGDDFTAALVQVHWPRAPSSSRGLEAYWLGARAQAHSSCAINALPCCWSAFALTDFFATDITNQRLRARQFNVGDGS
jgi:hypothetical protein